MPLAAGQTLTHYEILGSLGAGGMGEVYRARDTRLGREVAIKVLPEAFVEDEERLRRFEREARTLASLNHPNVGGIHGIDREDEVSFLALELVPGEDLAERLARGRLGVGEAVDLGRQIAEGLEAAHGAGVVHRDLKPANVRVTPDGNVKVLDFGLAKSVAADEPSDLVTTEEGRILGTPTYMSPEQARGRTVDARTDVWALGCVLFECLTGRRAFDGESVTDVLVAVAEKEPDWDALPRATPAGVRRLLHRCLDKDPRHRLQHVGEARIVLEDPSAAETEAPAAEPAGGGVRAVQIVGLAFLASAAFWLGGRGAVTSPPAQPIRLTLQIPAPQRLELPNPRSASIDSVAPPLAISPDGSTLVYLARVGEGPVRLFLRPLDRFEATPLSGTEGAEAPFFAPDGRWIGFFRDSGLQKIPIGGGAPLEICQIPLFDRPSAAWGADDTIVFTSGVNAAGRLHRVPAAGGTPTDLTVPDFARDEFWHGMPQVLPGEARVLFTIASRTGVRAALLDLDTGEWSQVEGTGDAAGARLMPGEEGASDVLVYAQAGSLVAVDFDLSTGTTRGVPRTVLASLSTSAQGLGHWDCSANGTLVYVPGESVETALVLADRSGEIDWRSPESGAFQHPRLSADGTRLLYDCIRSDGRDIWVRELPDGAPRRLTTELTNMDPLWVPGQERVVFSRFIDAVRTLHVLDIDRVGAKPRKLLEGEALEGNNQIAGTWSPAGALLFTVFGEEREDMWILPDLEQPSVRLVLGGPGRQGFGALSPDGRFLAYVSDETGTKEVYACSYPELTGKQSVSNGLGTEPLWSFDGTELFYRRGAEFWSVPVEGSAQGLVTGDAEHLFRGGYEASPTGHQHYDVSRDGRRFALVEQGESSNEISVVLNWRPTAAE